MGTKTIAAIVAGTGFEGRADIIRRHCASLSPVRLVREPSNAFDRNAIAVILPTRVFLFFKANFKIGYIKADRAEGLAARIDSGEYVVTSALVRSLYAPEGREHPRVSLEIHVSIRDS